MARRNRTLPGSKEPAAFRRVELPVAVEEEPEIEEEGMTYIAYAERGEDVAFELSEDLEEALEIYQSMKDDGFSPRLYQAREIEVTAQ